LSSASYNGKVIIIGAGAAGLYAAYLLRNYGIEVEVLEASHRYGGRLAKLSGFAEFPLDLGAEWLHGMNSITGDLVSKTQTFIAPDDSTPVYWFQGSLTNELPQNVNLFDQEGLPDISFWEYAQSLGLGSDYQWIIEALAGDLGAAATRISAYWNYQETKNWNSGDTDFKFRESFFDLIDSHIAKPIQPHIKFNTIVESVDYSGKMVKVYCQNGHVYEGDVVILTVPITVLKKGEIIFEPSLPSEKTEAFQKIGMDIGMKIFFKFDEKFYNPYILGGPLGGTYVDESIGKSGNSHILMSFVMGTQAENLKNLGETEAIIQALVSELDLMYAGKASAHLVDYYLHDWSAEPFIQGVYSYSTMGMGNARAMAAAPIDQKLFFAGEAMNLNGHHQTVHGAMETAWQTLNLIIR